VQFFTIIDKDELLSKVMKFRLLTAPSGYLLAETNKK